VVAPVVGGVLVALSAGLGGDLFPFASFGAY
jgi:hypothetical protein